MINPNEDRPTEWFEPLYKKASIDGTGVPWANMKTQPYFEEWLLSNPLKGNDKKALVVGCGMGDDAITLEKLGFEVTAFDVSETAINFCNQRFPDSSVNFLRADLFQAPALWLNHFDFILEIYTIQALPPKYEDEVISIISKWIAPKGTLLVIAAVTHERRNFKNGPPWLLNKNHVQKFESAGLKTDNLFIHPRADFNSQLYVSTFIRE